LPVFETAYASNGGNGNGNGNGNGDNGQQPTFSNTQGDACIVAGFNNCAGNINQQGENNFQQGVESGNNN
jgi:hypothetical protein